jgi:quercetin dioxygenase-like cupin family protein
MLLRMAADPRSSAQRLIRRAAALWIQARSAISREGRGDFERLAQLYEKMAVRIARRELHRSTLGDLLFSSEAKGQRSEEEWLTLVSGVGRRDQQCLQTLYLWSHRLVFTLIMRITSDWSATEAAALDVFHEVWQDARHFDPLDDTVIGWILNKARLRALREDPIKDAPPSEPLPFSAAFWERIAARIAAENDVTALPQVSEIEPEGMWQQPAPDLSCKILARDTERQRISMLVRLAPGGKYPAHIHSGVEQLYLLQGELCIDERNLRPGDYHRAEPGSADEHVHSATGCTCVLITSCRDIVTAA